MMEFTHQNLNTDFISHISAKPKNEDKFKDFMSIVEESYAQKKVEEKVNSPNKVSKK